MISSFCPLYICRKATQGPQRGALRWKRPPLFIIGNWIERIRSAKKARMSRGLLRFACQLLCRMKESAEDVLKLPSP